MISYKKYLKWDYIKRLFDVIQLLVVVWGVHATVVQVREIADNHLSRQNTLTSELYRTLTTGTNEKILSAPEDKKPLGK